jgi:DNA-binding PadR family transcriptional regulator
MRKPEFIDMKGLLSFHITWLLAQKKMSGEKLMEELGRRRDDRPSPGTLYPALNGLKRDGIVQKERDDKRMIYSLTPKGKRDLELAITYFKNVYGEIVTGNVRRGYSYAPGLKRSSEKDDLEIDFI